MLSFSHPRVVENGCILETGEEQEFKASLIYMRLSVKMKTKKKKTFLLIGEA